MEDHSGSSTKGELGAGRRGRGKVNGTGELGGPGKRPRFWSDLGGGYEDGFPEPANPGGTGMKAYGESDEFRLGKA